MTKFLAKYKDKTPYEIFVEWYKEAENDDKVHDHTEMNLSTCSVDAKPSNRVVLLKNHSEQGFTFFTNYTGRKSKEIEENPHAAICFYWPSLGKQIRIEGNVEMLSAEQSDEYFASRPRESQIGAWASRQSAELESYEKFVKELDKVRKKFENQDIPRPDFWGGWLIKPFKIEFWKAEEFRFHHRLIFEKDLEGNWESKQLYP